MRSARTRSSAATRRRRTRACTTTSSSLEMTKGRAWAWRTCWCGSCRGSAAAQDRAPSATAPGRERSRGAGSRRRARSRLRNSRATLGNGNVGCSRRRLRDDAAELHQRAVAPGPAGRPAARRRSAQSHRPGRARDQLGHAACRTTRSGRSSNNLFGVKATATVGRRHRSTAGTQEYENGAAVSTTGQFRAYAARDAELPGLCRAAAQQPALLRRAQHRQQRPRLRQRAAARRLRDGPGLCPQGHRHRQPSGRLAHAPCVDHSRSSPASDAADNPDRRALSEAHRMGDILSTSVSGLLAFQKALSVTSNNIANSATPGYSVENINLAEQPGSGTGGGYFGNGVDVTERHPLLQRDARRAGALLATQLLELQHARRPRRPDRQHVERLEHRAHGDPAELRQFAAEPVERARPRPPAAGGVEPGPGPRPAAAVLPVAAHDHRPGPRGADQQHRHTRSTRSPSNIANAQRADRRGLRRRAAPNQLLDQRDS